MSDARTIFNMLGRFIESGYKTPGAGYETLNRIVSTSPVFLFSREKVKAALTYAKEVSKHFSYEYAHECVVCDPYGSVTLMDIAPTSDGGVSGAALVLCHGDASEITLDGLVTWGLLKYAFIPGPNGNDWYCDTDREALLGGVVQFSSNRVTAMPLPANQKQALLTDCVHGVSTAFEELNYTFKPRVVVVTEVAAKMRTVDWGRRKDIPRAHQREVNIILDPEEIEIIRRQSGERGTHKSPIPHTRRAHTRTLRAERFGERRGQVIAVGETLVNARPGEVINTPQRIYHVVSVGGRRD